MTRLKGLENNFAKMSFYLKSIKDGFAVQSSSVLLIFSTRTDLIFKVKFILNKVLLNGDK